MTATAPAKRPSEFSAGDGCDVSPSCVRCPLVRCKYEEAKPRAGRPFGHGQPPVSPEREAESAALHARINAMIDAGHRWADIREALRCGQGTIQRARARARREREE